MSDLNTNIQRTVQVFDNIKTAIENKGLVIDNAVVEDYALFISSIGGELGVGEIKEAESLPSGMLATDGSIKLRGDYPALNDFLSYNHFYPRKRYSISGLTQNPSAIRVGENIYLCNYAWSQTGVVSFTVITEYNPKTNILSQYTVPAGYWSRPVVVGTDIYFAGAGGGGSYGSPTYISKFDTLAKQGTIIDVPQGAWLNPIVVGTDIYFYQGSSTNILEKYDTLTGVASRITFDKSFAKSSMCVVGSDIWLVSNATTISKLDLANALVVDYTVTAPNGSNLPAQPVVIGTNIHYTANSNAVLFKFNTLTGVGTTLPIASTFVLTGQVKFGNKLAITGGNYPAGFFLYDTTNDTFQYFAYPTSINYPSIGVSGKYLRIAAGGNAQGVAYLFDSEALTIVNLFDVYNSAVSTPISGIDTSLTVLPFGSSEDMSFDDVILYGFTNTVIMCYTPNEFMLPTIQGWYIKY